MPYIKQEERPYWDQFVNPFIEHLCAPGAKIPSKSGLCYALSRIVWAIFNRWPSWTVASDLRSVLAETSAEFKRRKQDAYEDNAMKKNDDLPEGCWGAWGIAVPGASPTAPGGAPDQQPLALPPSCKMVSMKQIHDCLEAGKSLHSLFYQEPDAKTIGLAKDMSNDIAKTKFKAPGKTEQKVEKLLAIADPDAEANAEKRLLLAIRAFALAEAAGASVEKMEKLRTAVGEAGAALQQFYRN